MAKITHTDAKTDVTDEQFQNEADQDLAALKDAQAAAQTDGAESDAVAAKTAKLSPKNKLVRKVPVGYKTTWVPLDLPQADNEKIQHAANTRGLKVGDMLGEILLKAIQDDRASLEADAAKYVPGAKSTGSGTVGKKKISEMTPQEAAEAAKTIQKRAEEAQARAMKMLAEARTRAQQANV